MDIIKLIWVYFLLFVSINSFYIFSESNYRTCLKKLLKIILLSLIVYSGDAELLSMMFLLKQTNF